jgi:2-dehydro-3-deoxy-L-rhamnonate dehydrogenase (NAD+)
MRGGEQGDFTREAKSGSRRDSRCESLIKRSPLTSRTGAPRATAVASRHGNPVRFTRARFVRAQRCFDASIVTGQGGALAQMNELDFKGRTAVISGGASGIGLAVARRLVASGGRVSLWDRDPVALEKAQAALAHDTDTQLVDVTDPVAVDAAAQAAARTFGGIDALVCSAGITGPNMTTWDYPVDAWRQVMRVNVDGVFLCNRAVVPIMTRRDYGRIVNIASVAGKEGNPNASAYSASKAAVIGLTKSLGKELAKTGIRVNCVTPAAVRTAMFEQMTQAHIDFMLSKIPIGRFGEVGEIAALVAWLCTEECSFSTGAAFDLSGGRATY